MLQASSPDHTESNHLSYKPDLRLLGNLIELRESGLPVQQPTKDLLESYPLATERRTTIL